MTHTRPLGPPSRHSLQPAMTACMALITQHSMQHAQCCVAHVHALTQLTWPILSAAPAPAPAPGNATSRRAAVQSHTVPARCPQVKCDRCTLWLNGLMLVDLWEAAPGGAPVAKASGPVNLTAAGPHKLELTFSTTKLEAAVLVLQWAPCSAPADAAALTSTAGIDSSAVWQPEQLMTGWLGGMQCDVWQAEAISQLAPPSYKFRLPDCPGPWHKASDSCQLPVIGTLGEMLPGLGEAQPGSRFSVRCYSYSSREFQGTLVAGPEDVHSRVWLAGAEVSCALQWLARSDVLDEEHQELQECLMSLKLLWARPGLYGSAT